MKFFTKFSDYNEKVPVTPYTCHTQRPFSGSSHKQCLPHSTQFCNRTNPSPSWSSESKPTHYKHCASASAPLSFPGLSSSSDSEETTNSVYGKIVGFISLFPVFTTDLIDFLFPPARGLLCCFPFVAYYVSRRDLRHLMFMLIVYLFIHLITKMRHCTRQNSAYNIN
jgi:hypothetical protein